jgi:hypothetical protein
MFAVLHVKGTQKTDWRKEHDEGGNWSAWTVLNDTPIIEVPADYTEATERSFMDIPLAQTSAFSVLPYIL